MLATLLAALAGCSEDPERPLVTQTEPEPVDDLTVGALDITAPLHEEIKSLVYVRWEQTGSATGVVEFTVDGQWRQSPEFSLSEGEFGEVLLLGVPYETAFDFRFVVTLDGEAVVGETFSSTTGALPEGLPGLAVNLEEPTAWVETDTYLLGSVNEDPGGWTAGTYWKFIIDRQGRYVWAHETPDENWTIFMRIAQDGEHILWDDATYWSQFDAGEGSQVHRMKLDGTIVESIETPGLHHAFVELPDGTLVWGAADWGTESLAVRPPGGEIETIWNCQGGFGVDFCQSNTLSYSEATDTFLYSFYTNSSVVELDRKTGEQLHRWGQSSSWDFDPPEAQFDWQHGVHYLPDGNLLLSTHTVSGKLETVVREYALDAKTQTLTEVWSFGVGEGWHADTAGEAHRLDNGNTLHNYGSLGALREVTPEGEIVWEVEWDGSRLLGRTVFIDDLYTFQ